MAIEGVDYAWDRPRIADLANAGKKFACRYLSNSTKLVNGVTKNLSLTEAKALAAAGLWIVSNWEWSAGDAKKGYAAGAQYAKDALSQAKACGMPAGRPIYFSVDFDPSSADWPAIGAYFGGITSVLGKAGTGIYGGYSTIAHAVDEHWCDWYWQTYAWSGGKWHPRAHIQQYRNGVTLAGANLDLDRATVADYGQWKPGITPEDDMFGDSDAARLRNIETYLHALFDGKDAANLDAGEGVRVTVKNTLSPQVAAILAKLGVDQVDEQAIVSGVLAGLSPASIAAAIPADLAQRVADELAARLAG